jgi:predicted nucleotidyltransferase
MLLELMEEHLPDDVQVIAYGSRVDGTAHDASDLDLSLKTTSGAPVERGVFFGFVKAVKYSNIPFLVDIFDYARLPESFQVAIDEGGVVLNDKTESV